MIYKILVQRPISRPLIPLACPKLMDILLRKRLFPAEDVSFIYCGIICQNLLVRVLYITFFLYLFLYYSTFQTASFDR